MEILLIDDDVTGAFLAKLLITRVGLFEKVITFQNPVDALSFVQLNISDGKLPRVILLDINMPIMDGWEFLEALSPYQQQLQLQNTIYLLTSSIDVSDIRMAEKHPLVTDIIFKPLAAKKILDIYEQVC